MCLSGQGTSKDIIQCIRHCCVDIRHRRTVLTYVCLDGASWYSNHNENGICQFLVYWSYICSFLSVWFVVCITVENYVTICHPTRIKTMCTVRRATIVTVFLVAFACTAYLPSIFSTHVVTIHMNGKDYKVCTPSQALRQVVKLLIYGDSIVTLIIPLALIFLMLLAISLAILKSVRQRRRRSVATNLNEKRRNKKHSSSPCRQNALCVIADILHS